MAAHSFRLSGGHFSRDSSLPDPIHDQALRMLRQVARRMVVEEDRTGAPDGASVNWQRSERE